MIEKFDFISTDFVYVRSLGDRHGIERITQVWDKTVIDRTDDLKNWAGLFRQFVSRNLKVYATRTTTTLGMGRVRSSCFGIRAASAALKDVRRRAAEIR